MHSQKVLLIGWDGADWKIIHPLLDAGKMPHLAALINNGVMGNLASLRPELSPMLWTSIATGKRPYKHGILGFTEPDPGGRGIRPVSNISRNTKTIWNILHQNNYQSVVIGWWPSYPVEPINGVMVSNHYQKAEAPYGQPWPMPKGTIHPQRLVEPLGKLRVHPQELDSGLMQLFLPDLVNIDQDENHRVEIIAKNIAETTTIKDAAVAIMQREPWDFSAVYFDGLDHFSHGFMNYHPPQLPWISTDEYELYNGVIESAYILHDIHLGALLKQCSDDTTVVLVSDHGFHSDHLRPARIPGEPAGPAAQHRPYGIVVLSGPSTKNDEIVYGSSLLDICPTLLKIFDLPVGQDMDGRPLVNSFIDPGRTEFISSWDKVEGEDGSHPEDIFLDPVESSEAINQLVELGYIEKPSDDQAKAASKTARENQYNLARSYMDGGMHLMASTILEDLYDDHPDEYRFGIELAYCLQAIGRQGDCMPMLENILEKKKENALRARKELKAIIKEKKSTSKPEDLSEEEQEKVEQLYQDATFNSYGIYYLLGITHFGNGEYKKALGLFLQAAKVDPSHPALFVQLGQVYEKMKSWIKAGKAYEKALAIDPENAEAVLGLCRQHLGLRKNLEAAHFALDALGLRYHNPPAHYFLGVALHRLGKLNQALEALEMSIRQNPNFPEAYRRLDYIYRKRLENSEKADHFRKLANEATQRIRQLKKGDMPRLETSHERHPESLVSETIRSSSQNREYPLLQSLDDTIVIVSGLPRSGTSMMMQMLSAGGLPLFVDNKRVPDRDNPRGYFENELVKKIGSENTWLEEIKGKGVKIISHLLPQLLRKQGFSYRVIFMERNYKEILASQKEMLKRQNRKGAQLPDNILISTFSQQLEKIIAILATREIPTLYINHKECIETPHTIASSLNHYLGGSLDTSSMAAVVDRSLYRQKSDNP